MKRKNIKSAIKPLWLPLKKLEGQRSLGQVEFYGYSCIPLELKGLVITGTDSGTGIHDIRLGRTSYLVSVASTVSAQIFDPAYRDPDLTLEELASIIPFEVDTLTPEKRFFIVVEGKVDAVSAWGVPA